MSYPKTKPRKAKRTRRYLGTRKEDFASFLADRLGDPDYYHKLSEEDQAWIAAFNHLHVQGWKKGDGSDLIEDTCTPETKVVWSEKRGKFYCNDKCWSCEQWRRVWREQAVCKKDMAKATQIFPKDIVEEMFAQYRVHKSGGLDEDE